MDEEAIYPTSKITETTQPRPILSRESSDDGSSMGGYGTSEWGGEGLAKALGMPAGRQRRFKAGGTPGSRRRRRRKMSMILGSDVSFTSSRKPSLSSSGVRRTAHS